MRVFSLWRVLRQYIFSFHSLVSITLLSVLYILFATVLLNFQSIHAILYTSFSVQTKVVILASFIPGLWTSQSLLDFSLLFFTAVLVSVNILFIYHTLSVLKHKGKIHASIGGATVIGLIATGCSSCGLSFLSVLGLSSSLSLLPFHGLELHLFSLFLLIVSVVYMTQQLYNAEYCKIPRKK